MIFKELPSNFSPVEIFEHFQYYPYSFFLDSALKSHSFGRYSFIGSEPFLIFKSKNNRIQILQKGKNQNLKGNPWDILQSLLSHYQVDSGTVPFFSGAVGYFSYDLGRHLERLPNHTVDDLNLPDCYLCFYDTVIVFDHWEKKTWVCSTGIREKTTKLRKQCAENELKKIVNDMQKRITENGRQMVYRQKFGQMNSGQQDSKFVSNFSYDNYLKAVEKAKDYIAQGEIYQVNLSQRFMGTVPEWGPSSWVVYKTLREINPAPFAAYLNFPEVKIVSASPERFLRISGRHVQTRPIKGTRPRGENLTEDGKLANELLQSKKDRAELVMIVDLERNDLGRVCEYGTVKVPKLVTLEKYPTVYHLVGTVEGILREDKTHLDCLRACFPGGSITGAPKIRSMEIIEELEPTKRSIYTGSIGYLGFNGETDLNIVIRTLLFTPLEIPKTYRAIRNFYAEGSKVSRFLTGFTQGRVYFQVGGGIVADSEPEAEYQETLDKAKALFACLNRQTIQTDYYGCKLIKSV